MTSKLFSLLVAASATLIAADAAAHIDLMTPPMRDGDQKAGPCEGVGAGARFELTAGETFAVTWNETTQHPGHFRIAIDDDGEDFNAPDNQADFDGLSGNGIILVETEGDTPDLAYSHDITVPNVNCDNCTLQLIQVMVDGDPINVDDDYYYRCADISIVGASGDGGAGGGSGNGGSSSNGNGGSSSNGNGGSSSNGTGSGASGSGEGGGSANNPSAPSGETHDCAVRAVGSSSPASSLAMALGLGAIASLAAARRRRRG